MRIDLTDNRRHGLIFLVVLCVVLLFPMLGAAPFCTKGEPREALVAVSMMKSGNWILPTVNGTDIAYKPPMLYWLISIGSLLPMYVNEATSRLPSAMALTLLVGGIYLFFSRKDKRMALAAALLTLANVEVFRAGMNARVDMLLTAFMVGAICLLWRYAEKARGRWWCLTGGVLCMSGAALTKGPVGILLPCLVIYVYALIRGKRWWRPLLWLVPAALAACVLPGLWYVAAYRQGGEPFLDLVIEENFGRFLGRMSYESHEKGLWYNFATLAAGWAPWTLLLLMSLLSLDAVRVKTDGWWQRLRVMDSVSLLALVASVVIFVFYCIPKSKRSVYLLPCYPFMAWFIAEWIVWLCRSGKRSVKIFETILFYLSVFLILAVCFMPDEVLPDPMLDIFSLLLICAATFLAYGIRKEIKDGRMWSSIVLTLGMLGFFFWCINPTVCLNETDELMVHNIRMATGNALTIYSHVPTPMERYYTLNFYLGGRIVPICPVANTESQAKYADGWHPDEAAKVKELFARGERTVYYMTGASAANGPELRGIKRVADTELVLYSVGETNDIKDQVMIYRLTPKLVSEPE